MNAHFFAWWYLCQRQQSLRLTAVCKAFLWVRLRGMQSFLTSFGPNSNVGSVYKNLATTASSLWVDYNLR